MEYALIEDGVIVNIIWLHPANKSDFKNAVSTGGLPVRVGDIYNAGEFYRDGKKIILNEELKTNEPSNVYGVPDEVYNQIVDDYTVSLMEGGLI